MIEFLLMSSPFHGTGSILGVPLGVVIVAIAFVLLAAGFVWMRRISRVDGEPRSFRATTHPGPLDRLVRGVALATVVFAAVFAVATLAAY